MRFRPAQVYIYGCVDATIDIKGKCKMVAIDGCKKAKVSAASHQQVELLNGSLRHLPPPSRIDHATERSPFPVLVLSSPAS